MATKIILLIFLILFSITLVVAQTSFNNIYPLKSSKKDVEKIMGKGVDKENNQIGYFQNNDEILVTYYQSGCDSSIEKGLGISKDTVLEIGIVLTRQVKLFDAIEDSRLYEKYVFQDSHNLYYDSKNGVLIVSILNKGIEFAEKLFFVPTNEYLPACILKNLGESAGLSILNDYKIKSTKGAKVEFLPLQIGTYFEEDSVSSKNEALNAFSKIMLSYKNAVGYIVLFKNKNMTSSKMLQRRKKLLQDLTKRGVSCKQILFVYGGIGELAGTSLNIVHKTFLLEMGLKPDCK